MYIGTSLVLIALGAILAFAVNATVSGISIATVGIILLAVGILGLILSFFYADRARRGGAVVREPVYREREVV